MGKMESLVSNFQVMPYKTEGLDWIYKSLSSVIQEYPSFTSWYFKKVIPDIRQGKRDIILYSHENRLAGVSIIKVDIDEKKICTLRVFHGFRNKGIGKYLFERSFELLETEKPLITVSESRLPQFSRLFDYYGFRMNKVYPNYYKIGEKEYSFNGELNT